MLELCLNILGRLALLWRVRIASSPVMYENGNGPQGFMEVSAFFGGGGGIGYIWGGIGYIWGEHSVKDHYLHKSGTLLGNIFG